MLKPGRAARGRILEELGMDDEIDPFLKSSRVYAGSGINVGIGLDARAMDRKSPMPLTVDSPDSPDISTVLLLVLEENEPLRVEAELKATMSLGWMLKVFVNMI